MKKTALLLFLLGLFLHQGSQAQTVSFTTSPQSVQCFVQGSNYGYAGLSNTVSAASYSWSVAGPGCSVSYTAQSNFPSIYVYYPCCGNYTLTCYAITGSVVSTYTTHYQITCTGSLSVSGTNTLCGGSTGFLQASGGTSYTWQPGNIVGDSVFVTPSVSTCYTVSSTNSLGCTSSGVKCIQVIPSTVSVSGNVAVCSGSYALLQASGASNYTWYPGGSTASSLVVTPSVSSCYTVQGFNAQCGVFSSAVKCLSVSPSPSLSITGATAVCGFSSTTLTANGASTYTWFGNNVTYTSSSIVVTPSTTTCYSLMGANTNGCYGYSGVCVSLQTNLSLFTTATQSICPGGSATLSASGAQTYTWYPGNLSGSVVVVSPTVSTCYTLNATGASGCSGSTVLCVSVQSNSTVGIMGPNSICAGDSTYFYAYGGTSYTWNPGGYYGGMFVASPSVSTCYTVNASTSCGVISAIKCLSVTLTNNTISISGPSVICAGTTATFTPNGAGNYTWFPGGLNDTTIVVSPSVSTCYTVVGTGCVGTVSAVKCVSVAPTPTLSISGSTTLCYGASGTLTASGANTYTWYGSSGTYTGSSIVFTAGASTCFSVVGASANGCLAYGGICVNSQNPLSVSGATSICAGSNATLIASGSSTGYTWQPGGLTGSVIVVSPATSVCYTVSGTSTTGCNASTIRCLQVNPKPTLSVYPTATLCIGQPASLVANGAATYTWLPSNTTGSVLAITPSASACYTVMGTNSWGCVNTAVGCFSAYPSASVSISGPNINCSGQSTTLTASGANSYYWLPGGMTGSSVVVSPSASVCYTVTGYPSGQLCPGSAVRCMSVLPSPVVSVSGNTSVCAGSSANLYASGALNYTWIPGNFTGSFVTVTPSVTTCYTVVGANASGCLGVNSICVMVKPKPSIYTSSSSFCAGQSDSLYAYGASNYIWLPYNLSGSHIVITPSVSSCYTVIGTNTAGCTNTATGCFSVNPAPVLTVSGSSVICAGSGSTLSASGASSYYWLPGGFTGANIVVSPSVSTCYTVYGTNAMGCSSSAVKCVVVQPGAFITISGNNNLCGGNSANLLASGANSYTWNNGATGAYISVSPSVSTCYTVIGQTSQGCIGSAVKCISVNATPYLSVSGLTTICQGASTTLQASGAASYWWSNGSNTSAIVVSPLYNSAYMVVGSNGACSSSITVNVNVNPKPFVYITNADSIICSGDSTFLYASGAASYTWNTGATGAYLPITPTASSVYSVVGTATNGCSNSAVLYVNVSMCTGVDESAVGLAEINIYPNPSQGLVNISGPAEQSIQVSLYDLSGRKLLQQTLTGAGALDLSGYAHGTYLLSLETKEQRFYKKLILE